MSKVDKQSGGSRPAVIIGGGVGPMAGVLLHQAIIRNTQGVQRDCDHIDVWHVSAVADMPDRTGFLLGDEPRNPAAQMAANVKAVGQILSQWGQAWRVAVPCATFHSPRIFDVFQKELESAEGYLGTAHLVRETISHLRELPVKPHRVGVLSTEGSYCAGVWRDPLLTAGLDVVDLDADEASAVHAAIYDPIYGLKAVYPPTKRAEAAVVRGARLLIEGGAQAIVLGCTELSFVARVLADHYGNRAIICDPLNLLALIVAADKSLG